MRNRAIITNVKPLLADGNYYIKRIPGEEVKISADIYCDGDDVLRASIVYKMESEEVWKELPMHPTENEQWEGKFIVEKQGFYLYRIEAWVDHLATWHHGFLWKSNAGQNLANHILQGTVWLRKAAEQADKAAAKLLKDWANLMENPKKYEEASKLLLSEEAIKVFEECRLKQFPTVYDKNMLVRVGRPKELFSTWYLMFPRSASPVKGQHGTFKDCQAMLPRIANMGFDVLFLPPIFPIGTTNRKGKNNSPEAEPGDVGSPWSVGNADGGHTAVNPLLGKMSDFDNLVKAASKLGIEVALDISLRCSADHPYTKEHPDWFNRLPNGQLAVEEVPPLNYNDIVDLNFECDDWRGLWDEMKNIFLFWAEKGVRIFYASTPHHQPFSFWNWLIVEVQLVYPDVIFLSGAFTRSVIQEELAKVGFNQSFTYFIWRNSNKHDLQQYITEIIKGDTSEFVHPNFFTNTPDILPSYLADKGPNAFMLQYALASMLSSNCGIYGPAFELMYNQRFPGSKERYNHSEKYEIAHHDWSKQNRVTDFITKMNKIRRDNPAMHNMFNLVFTGTDNEQTISFVRATSDLKNIVWCIINLDPERSHSGYVEVPKDLLGLRGKWFNLEVTDLLTNETYHWFNDWNFVELRPDQYPLHILKLKV
jgi:starch synthase (maltosyl-transferring)